MYFISFLPSTVLARLKRLSRAVVLLERRWLFPQGEYLTLPFLVKRSLLETPFLVFNFNISYLFFLSRTQPYALRGGRDCAPLLNHVASFWGNHERHNPAFKARVFLYLPIVMRINDKPV